MFFPCLISSHKHGDAVKIFKHLIEASRKSKSSSGNYAEKWAENKKNIFFFVSKYVKIYIYDSRFCEENIEVC
jgi:hypothetical protein